MKGNFIEPKKQIRSISQQHYIKRKENLTPKNKFNIKSIFRS